MYSLRLKVRNDEASPTKFVDLSAKSDDEAIRFACAQAYEHMPDGYTLVQARVCRGEEVIWSQQMRPPQAS